MFDATLLVLDWFGLCVFAATGALVAARKEMDVVGFALLATVTGIGGGTIRDVILDATPVFWVAEPACLLVCVAIAVVVFLLHHLPQSRYRFLLWFDAVGLSLFAVTGAERALAFGAGPTVAVAMGVATATFGGIVRDLLGGESPIILRREIYITAALAGAGVFVALGPVTGRELALVAGFLAAFGLRAAGLALGLGLPRYRARPGRTGDDLP